MKWLKKNRDRKKNYFESLDYLLEKYFPEIHSGSRVEALGSIGKIILMKKFEREVAQSKHLDKKEKSRILFFGKNFTKSK